MTLCDLTQSYAAHGGGIRTYLHAKRAWLDTHTSIRHVLIVPGEKDGVVREGPHVTYFVASPRVPGSNVYRLLLRNRRVREILDRERPDAIETLCGYNLPWAALRHQREKDPQCVVTAGYRTDFPSAYVEPLSSRVGGTWLAARATALAYRYVAKLYTRFDAVYALSPSFVEKLGTLGVSARLLPLGVDLEQFHPRQRDKDVRQRLGVADGAPLLVYAGRLDGEKRPLEVVEAFLKLPDSLGAHLAIVGDGPQRALLEEETQGERIHVMGFISDRDRYAQLLASADVYVSAMPHETFGISVVEAQASGLPVVGVRSGAMPNRVPSGLGRLGPVGDTGAMAANVEAVLREGAAEMGRRARAHVEAEFSWDDTFEQLMSLYEETLSKRRGVSVRIPIQPAAPTAPLETNSEASFA